jgi:transcription elongation factor Elf1
MINISSLIPDNKCPYCNSEINSCQLNKLKIYFIESCKCGKISKWFFVEELTTGSSYLDYVRITSDDDVNIRMYVNSKDEIEEINARNEEVLCKLDIPSLGDNPSIQDIERIAKLHIATQAFK